MNDRKQFIIITILVSVLLAVLLLNSTVFFGHFDLTEHRIYTISPVSKNLFTEISDTVSIKYYRSEKYKMLNPSIAHIQDILTSYAVYSYGKISVAFIDPHKDDLEDRVKTLGLVEKPVTYTNTAQIENFFSGIVIQYLDRYTVIPFVDRIESLEYSVTSAIRNVVTNREKEIGFLIGNFQKTFQNNYFYISLALNQSYSVNILQRGKPIPPNIDLLVILDNSDFSDEELVPVQEFLAAGKNALFAVNGVTVDLDKRLAPHPLQNNAMLELLASWGVIVNNDIVAEKEQFLQIPLVDSDNNQYLVDYPEWIKVTPTGVKAQNQITDQLTELHLYWASSLTLDNKRNKNLELVPLISSTADSFVLSENLITDPTQKLALQNNATGKPGERILGAIINGSFAADGQAGNPKVTSRAIVIGDADFISTMIEHSNDAADFQRIYNLAFFQNCIEWLTNDDDLIEIRKRGEKDIALTKISDPDKRKNAIFVVEFINIILIPVALIFFGLFRYFSRRKSNH
jgi:ABC-type uncharacterized transport system involved in gliding motility auxiliary subunit